MKTIYLAFCILIGPILVAQDYINQVKLTIFNDTLIVYEVTALINNFWEDEHSFNDSIKAKGGLIRARLTNCTDDRLVFTNILNQFFCTNESTGKSNTMNQRINIQGYSGNAELAFSVLDSGQNMWFLSYLGACCLVESYLYKQCLTSTKCSPVRV